MARNGIARATWLYSAFLVLVPDSSSLLMLWSHGHDKDEGQRQDEICMLQASISVEAKQANSGKQLQRETGEPTWMRNVHVDDSMSSIATALIEKSSPNTMTSVPPSLQKLGNKLLGVDADRVISQATAFNITLEEPDEHMVFLHSAAGDSASWHLPREFKHDPYRAKRLKGASSGTVVDIGSNLGIFTISVALANPKLQILAIEPVPLTYFFLKWNLLANHIPELSESDFRLGKPGVLAVHRAATNDGRDVEVEYSTTMSEVGITSASSSVSKLPEHSDYASSVNTVPMTDDTQQKDVLHAVVHSLHVPAYLKGNRDIRFLKIDCEGCEHEVVPDMEATGFLSNVEMGAGEVHECQGDFCHYSKDVVQNTSDILNKHGNFQYTFNR